LSKAHVVEADDESFSVIASMGDCPSSPATDATVWLLDGEADAVFMLACVISVAGDTEPPA